MPDWLGDTELEPTLETHESSLDRFFLLLAGDYIHSEGCERASNASKLHFAQRDAH